jgi:hypothetical protein
MRKSIFKAAMVVVFAFVAMSAGAQEVKETKRVSSGKRLEERVLSKYRTTETDSLTLFEKECILRNEARAFDPEHRNMLGWDRHKWGASFLAGANYVDRQLNPCFTARAIFETCHWNFEVEGGISRQKYTIESTAYGKNYLTWVFGANVGYKLWQDKLCRHYVSLLVNAGYGLQKTDQKGADFYSRNFGFTCGAMVRMSAGLAPHVRFVGEAGYKLYPSVIHSVGKQELKHSGPFINLGVSFLFNGK